ncbi:MAG: slipin family protein, partial [Proteobacteria bacterium]|nr:slipin family protein [Pseudomonadota bacterium]
MISSIKRKGLVNPISVLVFAVLFVLNAVLTYFRAVSLVLTVIGLLLAVFCAAAIRIADQWEKAVVLRMGKFRGLKGPGPFLIIPIIDRVH